MWLDITASRRLAVGTGLCALALLVTPTHAEMKAADSASAASAVPAEEVHFQVLPQAGESATDLLAVLQSEAGKLGPVPSEIDALNAWADRLTAALRQGGFPVGQVVVTERDWTHWQRTQQPLTVSVYPGRIEEIELVNHSRVRDARLLKIIRHALCDTDDLAHAVCLVRTSRLERATVLLQDVPGVALQKAPAFSPGRQVGGVRIAFDIVQRGKPSEVGVILDNQGVESTGLYRFGLSYAGNNAFGYGESYVAAFNVTDRKTLTGSVSGSVPLGDNGLRLTGGVSNEHYSINPGTPMNGDALTGQMGIDYPFVRALDRNVRGSVALLHTQTRTELKDFGQTQHSALDSVQLAMQMDSGERAAVLRQNQWDARTALTLGHQRNDDPLDSGPHRAGNYVKPSLQATGILNLDRSASTFVSARVNGQWSSRNLDYSEALELGGPNAVRAYRADEGSVDDGAILNLGLYHRFAVRQGHQLQLGAFVDYGWGRVNHSPWSGWESGYVGVPNVGNVRALSGYGASADWLTPVGATVSLSVARRFGFSSDSWVQPGSAAHQFWLSVSWNH